MIDPHDMNYPIRLRFRFSEAEAKALDGLARQRGVNSAVLIREWLHQAIEANNNTHREPTEEKIHVNQDKKPER